MATISKSTQGLITQVAEDPEGALELTEALAEQAQGQRIKVTITSNQRRRRPVRLTLKVKVGQGGERFVSLPEEAG